MLSEDILQHQPLFSSIDSLVSLPYAKVVNQTFENIFKNSNNSTLLSRRAQCELRALYLHMLSASQGHSESYLRVGDALYYGLAGVNSDKAEAAEYYQFAADMKHTHAIFNLGMMHEIG